MQAEYGTEQQLKDAKEFARTFAPSGTALTRQRIIDRMLGLQKITADWAARKGLDPQNIDPKKLWKATKELVKEEKKRYRDSPRFMKDFESEGYYQQYANSLDGLNEAKGTIEFLKKNTTAQGNVKRVFSGVKNDRSTNPFASARLQAAKRFVQEGGPTLQEPVASVSEFANTSRQLAPGGPPRFVR